MTQRLCIFDLDGVLLESRELHYDALNAALASVGEEFIISREEHLSLYDGLNTTRKLDMLTERKGLPKASHGRIWGDKQVATFDLIKKFPRDERAIKVMHDLRARGWKIAVCSNSIRETIKLALMAIGVMEYVDIFVSNEDVRRAKPYPMMYWQAMDAVNALPKNTIIIEDSHIGRQGAIDSGAHLLAVENAHSWNYATVMEEVHKVETNQNVKNIPWRDSKLTVVIPAAGAGSRFAEAGYAFPKPLIEVGGKKPMLQAVVENLNVEANFVFLVQRTHYEQYGMKHLLNLIAPNCKIVLVDGVTEGAACTTLLAKEFINTDGPLLFANSDQILEHSVVAGDGGYNANEILYAFKADDIDGGLICFNSSHPKWSFCALDENGFVSEVVEKKPISDIATTGIYYWKHGSDFVKYAEQMIEKNIRHANEFYVAPVYQQAIDDGKKIKVKMMDADKFWGVGTPADLDYFHAHYKGKI